MKAAAFDYSRAASVEEACALLARHGPDARLIAGGQSLVPMMAMRLVRPAVLVDIQRIASLNEWRVEKDFLCISACVRQNVIEREAALSEAVPLLGKAIRWIGHVQTRNRGTVGGSLAHADPSAELPLVVATLGAQCIVRSFRGERTIGSESFFTGPMSTALQADECLVEIRLPIWGAGRIGTSFEEVAIRHGDFALVAVAAQVALNAHGVCERAALGVGGAAPAPVAFPDLSRHLVGTQLDDAAMQAIADTLAKRVAPMSDLHASAAYRRHLAHTLTLRTLRAARDEALTRS
ncbi:MAG: xanthine dehydrogenase family protein subunit M [Betaproteobacteria bacterium]|nr:xanthine dehydrogenase family protein subunit M [Betaproteobacteria bacterium]